MLVGIVEFLGWFGAITVLAGYILFSTGKLPNGPAYQLLNLVGGLSIAVNVAAHGAVPSTIVNGIWALVAVVVLVKMLRARRAGRRGVRVEPPALHTEPPTTTAVLPVIGPAVRQHDVAEPVEGTAVATTSVQDEPTAPAPMTESVPVITATIALALVAVAQEQAQAQAQAQEQAQAHEQAQAQTPAQAPEQLQERERAPEQA